MKKALLLLLLLATTQLVSAQKKSKTAQPQPPMERLSLNNPTDAIKMNRKVTSSLTDAENCFYFWSGNIFSRVPGEKDRLLFTYNGMNVRASKTVVDSIKGYGWRHVSRELLFYQDPQTGEVLKTWKNPFTGKEIEVIHIANDPVNGRGPSYAMGNDGKTPFKLKGYEKDGYWFDLTEVPLFYTNPLGGDYQDQIGGTYQAMEIFQTITPMSELTDPNTTKSVNSLIGWTRVSKWLPWLDMGDKAGQMIFTGIGKKVKSFDDLPQILKDQINTNYPDYKVAPPVDDTRPNETSWTYYKKLMEKKRAKK